MNIKAILVLEQFHPSIYPYVLDVINMKTNGHYDYQTIVLLLGMEEES